MLLQVRQDLLLLLYLAAVVLCLLVGYLYLELVVVQLLLLPLDLDAQLHVLLLKALLFLFDLFVNVLLLLGWFICEHAHPCASRQPVYQFLAFLGQHFQLHLFVDVLVGELVRVVVELRDVYIAFHAMYEIYME